jgi:hypothetical protein
MSGFSDMRHRRVKRTEIWDCGVPGAGQTMRAMARIQTKPSCAGLARASMMMPSSNKSYGCPQSWESFMDRRVKRAFTPVFGGLCPAMTN